MRTPERVIGIWSVYDAFVRGAMIDELADAARRTEKQIGADIDRMRKRMRDRYGGITDREADELRAIYLLAKEARTAADASSLRIVVELRLRARDIVDTAASREFTRLAKEREHYQ